MALRDIIKVGDPRLRQSSRDVRRITPKIQQFIDDMVETMRVSDGLGLAAVQVAEMLNIIVIEVPENEDIPGSGEQYIVINPEIVKASRDVVSGIEGCLSVPGFIGEVDRSTEVVVRGLDRYGKKFHIRARDFLARVFQHEIDHCKGVLYIDRLTAPDRIWPVEEGEEEQAELERRSEDAVGVAVEAVA